MAHATDYIYKPVTYTLFQVPSEIKKQIDDYIKKNGEKSNVESGKTFTDKLEKIVCYWVQQIREALQILPVNKEVFNIYDHQKFWNHRCNMTL